MGEDLAAHGIDKELDTLLRAQLFRVFVVVGLDIRENKLARDIYRFYGDI